MMHINVLIKMRRVCHMRHRPEQLALTGSLGQYEISRHNNTQFGIQAMNIT